MLAQPPSDRSRRALPVISSHHLASGQLQTMMSRSIPTSIASRLSSLPNEPGVYLWKGEKGEVLYVGKAKRLRQRVRNYFTADHAQSPKNQMLLRLVHDLDTIVVPSESQALLLENNLIKEYRPRFNLQLRDDKSYPRIAVTLSERIPRVLVVRRLNIEGARFFGPYTDVGVLRRTLRIIRRIFTVRSCHYALPDEVPDRPCLDYHIHRCLAPCVGYQSEGDYRDMIDDVVAFLEGKTVAVRSRLRARMEEASARMDFERAAEIRNALSWLAQLEQPQAVEIVGGRDADVVGFARDGDDAVGVVICVRQGRVVAREQRFLENLAETGDPEILSRFLVQHYLVSEGRARRVVLPFAPDDFDALSALVASVDWIVPKRGVNQRLAALADQNARHLLESFKIEALETDERAEDPVYALGRDLGLTTVPRAFVCIDISTNQGRDTVGSLVWFEAGRPKKSEYRRYGIQGTGNGVQSAACRDSDAAPSAASDRPPSPRTLSDQAAGLADARPPDRQTGGASAKPDDYAAIKEVVTRFLSRRVAESKPLPDLMVIDGGKGQMSAAREALEDLGLADLPLASLAKREEEVFLPGRSQSLKLPARSPSLRLLQRARDEAHRFAVSFSRKRRTGRTITSELLHIPGVGEKRRRQLLAHFGSLAGVRLATSEEIAALPGFSQKLADRILESLRT